MSNKYVMVTLAFLVSAGFLFCGCDDKKQPEGQKPGPSSVTGDTGEAPKVEGSVPNVKIVFC